MILLTGASGGLGSKLFRELEKIDDVIGTYYTNKPSGGKYYKLDITDECDIREFLKEVSPKLKNITLVNLAGISIDKVTHSMPLDEWNKVISVNLTGSFLMSRHILPYMVKGKWGRIINISSIVSDMGAPGTVAYASSKSGLGGMTRTIALEYARYSITANCLSLGYYSSGLINTIPAKKVEMIKEMIPMKRLGTTKDIAIAIKFLIDCSYITGSTINLTGGMR